MDRSDEKGMPNRRTSKKHLPWSLYVAIGGHRGEDSMVLLDVTLQTRSHAPWP